MMWRTPFLYLSTNRLVRQFATRNPIARGIASRFVAGEILDDAIDRARLLSRKGADVEVDYLGENVVDASQAEAARDAYLSTLDHFVSAGLQGHVSLKLTQMGLDVDESVCVLNLESVLRRAEETGSFVWIDMEGSGYVESTIDLYDRALSSHRNVGIALQAYLYRTKADLAYVVSRGGTVRLCKGAYSEAASVAYPAKSDVDASYMALEERLLCSGRFHAIATHDESMIRHAVDFAREHGVSRDSFEFQMLYGVRRDLQDQLVREGYHLRVYLPYGLEWYPYFMRRLAERPANLVFLLGSVSKERGRHPSERRQHKLASRGEPARVGGTTGRR